MALSLARSGLASHVSGAIFSPSDFGAFGLCMEEKCSSTEEWMTIDVCRGLGSMISDFNLA
jgi:hypothetical protein